MTSNAAVARRRTAAEAHRSHPVAVHRPKLRPWIAFTVAVVVAFFGLIYSRISLDRTAFELEELEDHIAEQEALVFELELEVARLQDPARIDRLAGELGLEYPRALVAVQVPSIESDQPDPELRLAQLNRLLTAQP
jgi:cell division protein FtsL